MTPLFKIFLAILIGLIVAMVFGCGGNPDEQGQRNRLPLNCDVEDCTK
jgi:hypothetical protein